MNFDRLGKKKVRPGTFGKMKSRLTGVHKKYVKKHEISTDPISADPILSLSDVHALVVPAVQEHL